MILMGKCIKCSRFGLNLKLDASGLCPDCQSISKRVTDDRISKLETELYELRRFHDEYLQIPNAKAEADRILSHARSEASKVVAEANQTLDDVKAECDRLYSDASAKAETLRIETDEYKRLADLEISMKRKELDAKLAAVKSDTKIAVSYAESQLAALFALAAKDFAHSAKSSAVSAYAISDKITPVKPTSFAPITPAVFKRESKSGYVVFDLETTGLNRSDDAIIEIGAIKYGSDGERLDSFSTLINPGRSIPPSATAINNITDSMVANAPNIADVLPAFYEFVGGFPLIAHNSEFDISFLTSANRKYGIEPSHVVRYGDSLAMAKRAFKLQSYRLGAIADHLNIPASNAHRSMGDCEVLGQIVKDILERNW